MKRARSGSLETKVRRFLFHYRTTPHSTTGSTPAELLMGRKLRTHLDMMHLDLNSQVQEKQRKQIANRNKGAKDRRLTVGEPVYVRDLPMGSTWIPGIVTEGRGPRTYIVRLSTGQVVRRHIDHVRHRDVSIREPDPMVDDTNPQPDGSTEDSGLDGMGEPELPQQPTQPWRSSRNRRPPDRLAPYISS